MVLFFDEAICILKDEADLFEKIRKFVQECFPDLTVRVVGGWVRDKLIGKNTKDIDIALDLCSGVTFASDFTKWLYEKVDENVHFHIIKSNPEKSKHLETASMPYKSFELDFVHLRVDDYTTSSRIPKVEIGSPYQDACRRDFTINALFYNILTGKIEDHTELGMLDLKEHRLRTPMEPFTTFLDDPLRLLRGIRFVSTLSGYSLDNSILKMENITDINEALTKKVSGERVRKELEQMMLGNSSKASALLEYFDLYKSIFSKESITPKFLLNLPYHTVDNEVVKKSDLKLRTPDKFTWLMIMYSALLCCLPTSKINLIMMQELRTPRKMFDIVLKLILYSKNWEKLIDSIKSGKPCDLDILRKPEANFDFIFTLKSVLRHHGVDLWDFSLALYYATFPNNLCEIKIILRTLESENLLNNVFKPLPVNGSDVMKRFQLNPGSDVKNYLNYAVELCLRDFHYFDDKEALLAAMSNLHKKSKS